MRHLNVDGSYNVRDLGGFATEAGQYTRWNVFIRAGNLDKVSAAGRQYLTDYGVKTVIDLRDEWEVESYPNVFARATDVKYAHLPLIGNRLSQDEDWKARSEQYVHLHDLYRQYLEQCQPQIGAIMGAIIESNSSTIFHCYAGKDRTGLIAALILGAVGVAADVIADDYAQTSQHIKPLVAEWRANAIQNGRSMQQFERDSAAAAQTMIETLNGLTTRYGSVSDYLVDCGLAKQQLVALRERFVVEDRD